MSEKRTSRLLIDEQPLQVLPSLAVALGLNRATFLQQLHYWLQKPGAHVREGRRWVFNTFEEWHEQFPFWSAEVIRKIVAHLEAKGMIETTDRFNKRKGDRTKWYTINYEAVDSLFGDSHAAPEKFPQPSDQPENLPVQPENLPQLEPEKFTQRYQESTRDYNRDSDLQSGEAAENGVSPPREISEKSEKAKDLKQFAVAELMERVAAASKRGASIHSPTNDERKQFARMFEQASKDGYDVDTLLSAFDYQVAKAAGEVEGEPRAWCGYRTALDRIDEGWHPRGAANAKSEAELQAMRDYDEETRRLIAEAERERAAKRVSERESP